MKKGFLFFAVLAAAISVSCNEPSQPELKGRRVLIVFGGWDGHEPGRYVGILLPWLTSEGAMVDTTSSLEIYTDSAYMVSVDLIIQAFTMSQITPQQEDGLLRAVREGAGLAGWHGGLALSLIHI